MINEFNNDLPWGEIFSQLNQQYGELVADRFSNNEMAYELLTTASISTIAFRPLEEIHMARDRAIADYLTQRVEELQTIDVIMPQAETLEGYRTLVKKLQGQSGSGIDDAEVANLEAYFDNLIQTRERFGPGNDLIVSKYSSALEQLAYARQQAEVHSGEPQQVAQIWTDHLRQFEAQNPFEYEQILQRSRTNNNITSLSTWDRLAHEMTEELRELLQDEFGLSEDEAEQYSVEQFCAKAWGDTRNVYVGAKTLQVCFKAKPGLREPCCRWRTFDNPCN